eukprot:2144845-Heterocapsa_arctica.AAC.1
MRWFFVDGHGPAITFETLADSGGDPFRSLDIELSTSLGKIVKAGPASLAANLQDKERTRRWISLMG